MTPAPPEGFKIIPRAYLEAGNPLPDDTLFFGEFSGQWIKCPARGRRACNFDDLHATAQPLPCFQKGGDEPCRTILDSATPVSDTDGLAGGRPVLSVRSNAPVEVPSPDQGPEHNPDGLTPEQYGAPEWRLLLKDEDPIVGDEVVAPDRNYWLTLTPNFLPGKRKSYTYRRRVTPEPEQARNNALAKLAYEQSGEPRTECPTQGRRIAELEREIESVRHCGNEERRRLTRERDEARAEAKCCSNPLCGWIPQTYGEAVIGKWIKGDECINYEWDNRTTAENAKWLIELYRAQLAASEKDREARGKALEKFKAMYPNSPHIIRIVDAAMKEAK